MQLLLTQIPKEQKTTNGLTVIFMLLGLARAKALQKMLLKLTPALHLFLSHNGILKIIFMKNYRDIFILDCKN